MALSPLILCLTSWQTPASPIESHDQIKAAKLQDTCCKSLIGSVMIPGDREATMPSVQRAHLDNHFQWLKKKKIRDVGSEIDSTATDNRQDRWKWERIPSIPMIASVGDASPLQQGISADICLADCIVPSSPGQTGTMRSEQMPLGLGTSGEAQP